jgi:hypothetical protein
MRSKIGVRESKKARVSTQLAGYPIPARRMRRGRDRRGKRDLPTPQSFIETPPTAAMPDPVQIAVLTLEHLSRASLRASFTGKEVCVAAPDAATAAIFRAALSQTARTRGTDRLIRVVVD